MTNSTYGIYDISLADNQICKIFDLSNGMCIKKFSYPFTGSQYKIYILVDAEKFLYIGTTKNSIKNRLRYGLTASGNNGYHGYKWKNLSSVRLYVWCFEEFDKEKIENVEAELVYLIRRETGSWPIYQNEIHFNNSFLPMGSNIAEELFRLIEGIN